jgi:pantoate--beta-alanine ligase
MSPVLVRSKAGLEAVRASLAPPVVLVPTMGALHDGHRTLLRLARELAGPAGTVMASVFVNPLQFGPAEDFDRYPRPLNADLDVCAQEGVGLVFAPGPRVMYPRAQAITVDPGPAGRLLEGEFRPGFFTGVLTVVLKLLELTRPQVAVFGEKDAQQLALIRRMTADLNLPVRIASVPISRDPDGLATSSRNAYLSAADRAVALAIPAALAAGRDAAGDGPKAALAAAQHMLDTRAGQALAVDYLTLADPESFTPVDEAHTGPALLAIAAKVGATRLIDNMPLVLDGQRSVEP